MITILKETTEWQDLAVPPNHIYIMRGSNAIGYLRWCKGNPIFFDAPLSIDKRYRKFVEIKDSKILSQIPKEFLKEEPKEKQETKPSANVRVFKVKSKQKNKEYLVEYNTVGKYISCNCVGFGFRRKCKHSDYVLKIKGLAGAWQSGDIVR